MSPSALGRLQLGQFIRQSLSIRAAVSVPWYTGWLRGRKARPPAYSSAFYNTQGRKIDVAMLDSSLSFLAMQVAEYSVAGVHHAALDRQRVAQQAHALGDALAGVRGLDGGGGHGGLRCVSFFVGRQSPAAAKTR